MNVFWSAYLSFVGNRKKGDEQPEAALQVVQAQAQQGNKGGIDGLYKPTVAAIVVVEQNNEITDEVAPHAG